MPGCLHACRPTHHLLGHAARALPEILNRTAFLIAGVAEIVLLQRLAGIAHRALGLLQLLHGRIFAIRTHVAKQILKLALEIVLALSQVRSALALALFPRSPSRLCPCPRWPR